MRTRNPGKICVYFCYPNIPTLVKVDVQPWMRHCWSNNFVYIGYANICHNVCQEMKLSLFSLRHCRRASPRLFCPLSFFLSNKCTRKHKHAALPFSNISCPPPASLNTREQKSHTNTTGETALFRFLFLSLHKDILSQKGFPEDSCTTPIASSQIGAILLLSCLLWLIWLFADLSLLSLHPLWFTSTLNQQVEQCVMVLGVSGSLALGCVTWLHPDPSGPLIPKEWFNCSECLNWFFCDLQSTFGSRRQNTKNV